jgi:hypothetical protein
MLKCLQGVGWRFLRAGKCSRLSKAVGGAACCLRVAFCSCLGGGGVGGGMGGWEGFEGVDVGVDGEGKLFILWNCSRVIMGMFE